MFKGKLTYTMLAGLLVSAAARILGDGVLTEADANELIEAALALVAVYGRYRATRS